MLGASGLGLGDALKGEVKSGEGDRSENRGPERWREARERTKMAHEVSVNREGADFRRGRGAAPLPLVPMPLNTISSLGGKNLDRVGDPFLVRVKGAV